MEKQIFEVCHISNDLESLRKLLKSLQAWLPYSNMVNTCNHLDLTLLNVYHPILKQMAGLVCNVIKNVVTAEFFSDGWPDFTSIVCRIINPNVSYVVVT